MRAFAKLAVEAVHACEFRRREVFRVSVRYGCRQVQARLELFRCSPWGN